MAKQTRLIYSHSILPNPEEERPHRNNRTKQNNYVERSKPEERQVLFENSRKYRLIGGGGEHMDEVPGDWDTETWFKEKDHRGNTDAAGSDRHFSYYNYSHQFRLFMSQTYQLYTLSMYTLNMGGFGVYQLYFSKLAKMKN